ncbi:MAG: diacylglycerol kinase family lipid kinase [Prolixibacteraceae bacterium]|jgi:diacylglycerol kinase (ATP)|nr:diacylglycerol kinase family lipid kinase [Prolixibacteraceae bacterium]
MEKNTKGNWLVVLNPNAGGNQALREWPLIEQELLKENFSFEIVRTERPKHAISLVKEKIEKGFRKIIIIGGDGTLHEVVNGIMSQNKTSPSSILLGMISMGTGNDWIKTHQISKNFKEAIQQIKEGKTIFQDVGKIIFKHDGVNKETRYFINSVGIGFDAKVLKYSLAKKEKGKSKKSDYITGLIKSLFTNKNIDSLIQLDSESINTKVYNLTIGVCQYKGGGFKLLPNAIPDDGMLDVTLACKISKRKLIVSLPKIFGGKVDKIKYFDFYQVRDLKLDISGPICTEADGEYLGLHPLHVSIVPNQLQLISSYKNG